MNGHLAHAHDTHIVAQSLAWHELSREAGVALAHNLRRKVGVSDLDSLSRAFVLRRLSPHSHAMHAPLRPQRIRAHHRGGPEPSARAGSHFVYPHLRFRLSSRARRKPHHALAPGTPCRDIDSVVVRVYGGARCVLWSLFVAPDVETRLS